MQMLSHKKVSKFVTFPGIERELCVFLGESNFQVEVIVMSRFLSNGFAART